MSTRGHVTLVDNNHQYGYYKHQDSYPSGWPSDFLREAVEVAREGSWDAVRDVWLDARWVDYEDHEHSMSKLRELTTRETGVPVDDVYALKPWPGVRSIEGLPAVLKEPMVPETEFNDRQYAMVMDFDHNKVVMLKYMGPWRRDELRYPDFRPVPIAQASMDDPEGIEDIIAWAQANTGKSVEKLDPPPEHLPPYPDGRRRYYVHHDDQRFLFHTSVGGPDLVPFDPYDTYHARVAEHLADFPPAVAVRDGASAFTGRDWPTAPHTLHDGMWLRPEGFPPLDGTPVWFPAKELVGDGGPDELAEVQSHGVPFDPVGLVPFPAISADNGNLCGHIGVRNGKPCVRPRHDDEHHRYR